MKFPKKCKEALFLTGIIVLFIIIRSINFNYHLNFSHDQGQFSSEALNIYNTRSIVLIGPSISYDFEGREIFQGSAIYYFLLVFLIIGKFEPVLSSYIFMLFASIMVIPLYYGIKQLQNNKSAIYLTIIYALFPFYVDYTRFLWNPNFQLVLLPFFIYLMGTYKTKKKHIVLWLIGVIAGFLMQFHYQFIFIILGLIIYYFLIKKDSFKNFMLFCTCIAIGLTPLILFEIRNNFYNIRTIILFISNYSHLINNASQTMLAPHYFLSISFFIFIIIFSMIQKILFKKITLLIFTALSIMSMVIYLPKPTHAFGMPDHWNYIEEEKVNAIIKNSPIENYNIANIIYDTQASVQKYLLKKDRISVSNDYYNDEYLFVLSKKDGIAKSTAYEVSTFKPSKVIEEWEINEWYNLYLLKRINK